MKEGEEMSFDEALEILNISDFKNDIFNSNSHGELFHLIQYIELATFFTEYQIDANEGTFTFRDWFLSVVDWAKETQKRPESIYQHILPLFQKAINKLLNEKS